MKHFLLFSTRAQNKSCLHEDIIAVSVNQQSRKILKVCSAKFKIVLFKFLIQRNIFRIIKYLNKCSQSNKY